MKALRPSITIASSALAIALAGSACAQAKEGGTGAPGSFSVSSPDGSLTRR